MKNKILSQFSQTIPYIKELRALTSSVTASILMQQLDYWFARYPGSFYKFLAPCDNIAYVPGKSWTEELAFSEREFRTAFDLIGIRYPSKSQFEKAGSEKFKGKFYCSYVDKHKGTTYYLRNHDKVDAVLKQLSESAPKYVLPQPDPLALVVQPNSSDLRPEPIANHSTQPLDTDISVTAQTSSLELTDAPLPTGDPIHSRDDVCVVLEKASQKSGASINHIAEKACVSRVRSRAADCAVPELTDAQFRNCASVSSRDDVSAVPYKETNTENTKEITAADAMVQSKNSSNQINLDSAAAFSSGFSVSSNAKTVANNCLSVRPISTVMFGDSVIGESLTSTQISQINQMAEQLSSVQPEIDTAILAEEIAYVVLQPQSFSGAGRDFLKKLNTIRKCIRQGNWTRPAQITIDHIKAKNAEIHEIELTLRELTGERRQLKQFIQCSNLIDNDARIKLQKQLIACEAKIKSTEAKIKRLRVEEASQDMYQQPTNKPTTESRVL